MGERKGATIYYQTWTHRPYLIPKTTLDLASCCNGDEAQATGVWTARLPPSWTSQLALGLPVLTQVSSSKEKEKDMQVRLQSARMSFASFTSPLSLGLGSQCQGLALEVGHM